MENNGCRWPEHNREPGGKKQAGEPIRSGVFAERAGHVSLGYGERQRVDHGMLFDVAAREEETDATVVKGSWMGLPPACSMTKLEVEGEDEFSPVERVLRPYLECRMARGIRSDRRTRSR